MNDLNKLINEVNQSVANRNKATARTESPTPRYAKSRTQLKQKDPVVAWLESESDIDEVYLDDMSFIVGTNSSTESVVHDVETIMKAIPNSVNKKGVDAIEEWLNEESVIDTEIA